MRFNIFLIVALRTRFICLDAVRNKERTGGVYNRLTTRIAAALAELV